MVVGFLAGISLSIWIYFLFGRGGFWKNAPFVDVDPSPLKWPAVTAIIPARNESETIGQTIRALLTQVYPGQFSLVLVDDQSVDSTVEEAGRSAADVGEGEHLTIVSGEPLPAGWVGKVWAMKQGVDHTVAQPPDFFLFIDADITLGAGVLRDLVSTAERHELVLASLMAKLRCVSFAERAMVPAFIFFFQMLYPFSWVNRIGNPTAAAAGGCMLVRRAALESIGGLQAIRGALIDDCAIAQRLKPIGPVRLELTDEVASIRKYPAFSDIRNMVVRSAYTQLGYSSAILIGTVAGMILTYVVPVALAVFGRGFACAGGLAAWLLMAISFQPTLRFYKRSPLWGLALPLVAFCYVCFTVDSAFQFWRGRGGLWKGRAQAASSGAMS